MAISLLLDDLAVRFDDFLRRYQQWSAPLEKYFEKNWPARGRDPSLKSLFEQELKALQTSLLKAHDPHAELQRILDEVCPAYLNASSDERAAVRRLVSARPKLSNLIRGHAARQVHQINASTDEPRLCNALAAISLEDCRTDFRDTFLVLADLYVGAEEVGLDSGAHFQAVAQLSSDLCPLGGPTPLKEVLGSLGASAIVAERRNNGRPFHER